MSVPRLTRKISSLTLYSFASHFLSLQNHTKRSPDDLIFNLYYEYHYMATHPQPPPKKKLIDDGHAEPPSYNLINDKGIYFAKVSNEVEKNGIMYKNMAAKKPYQFTMNDEYTDPGIANTFSQFLGNAWGDTGYAVLGSKERPRPMENLVHKPPRGRGGVLATPKKPEGLNLAAGVKVPFEAPKNKTEREPSLKLPLQAVGGDFPDPFNGQQETNMVKDLKISRAEGKAVRREGVVNMAALFQGVRGGGDKARGPKFTWGN